MKLKVKNLYRMFVSFFNPTLLYIPFHILFLSKIFSENYSGCFTAGKCGVLQAHTKLEEHFKTSNLSIVNRSICHCFEI